MLPFANMSGDPEQEYFSDGITEDIITDLGKVSALSIVSRNTAFSFKGSTADVAQIARQTKASYVLVGSVRKSGARVRITAQLIGAANDSQVWGERYDRDLNDIFALQDEISKAIVAALKLTLLPEEKQALEQRSTTNPEAYKLYLMARQFWLLDNERNNEIVVRICNRVVEIDPNYAQAWATLALAQWNMFWRGDSGDDGERAAGNGVATGSQACRLARGNGCRATAAKDDSRKGCLACQSAMRLEPNSYVGNRIAGLCCLGCGATTMRSAILNSRRRRWNPILPRRHSFRSATRPRVTPERMKSAARRALWIASKRSWWPIPVTVARSAWALPCWRTWGRRNVPKSGRRRARLVDPENVNLHYNLACAMSSLGEIDLALETLDGIASKLSPGMVSWLEADTDLDANSRRTALQGDDETSEGAVRAGLGSSGPDRQFRIDEKQVDTAGSNMSREMQRLAVE